MATKHEHDNPILVTGAAGDVGAIGRNLTECPARQAGTRFAPWFGVRTSVPDALRQLGAEVTRGDLTDLCLDAPRHRRLRARLFRHVCVGGLSRSHGQRAAMARHYGVEAFVNMSQMTVTQMSITRRLPARSTSCTGSAEQALVLVGVTGDHSSADSLP